MSDYLAYEKKVWQPFAETMAKDGVRTGWSLNVQVLPSGSDLKFQAVTVDVFPSWDAVYQGLRDLQESPPGYGNWHNLRDV